ncbi:hypothetical protein CRG98_046338 [Punica granatum]|uniref:Integrase catalytic domain-containing protein n=1 Tax=Punica granatum TaxID=22663 RepID=A0A2I0HNH9_PUNGR|nr:hypothetical protein CRG98_046338 [Punica granatum]
MTAPWPFSMWGMDVIGPINPKASNGHVFIQVAIDYFTKWIEAITLASVTAKAVAHFLRSDVIARYGVLATIITDNAKNLNNKGHGRLQMATDIMSPTHLYIDSFTRRSLNDFTRLTSFVGFSFPRTGTIRNPKGCSPPTASCLTHAASHVLEAPKIVEGCATPPKPTVYPGPFESIPALNFCSGLSRPLRVHPGFKFLFRSILAPSGPSRLLRVHPGFKFLVQVYPGFFRVHPDLNFQRNIPTCPSKVRAAIGGKWYQSCRRAEKGGAYYGLWLHPLTEHATKEKQAVSTPFWPTSFLHENPRSKPRLLFITRQSKVNVRSQSHERQEKSWVH